MTSIPLLGEQNPPPSQDVRFLQEEARRRIEALASELWTDYNTHDPGITLLELLSYAITDLGLRSRHEMADLLAGGKEGSFYTAREVLPNAALTPNDYRRLLLSLDFIRDARVASANETGLDYRLQGLYLLRVLFEGRLNESWIEQEIVVRSGEEEGEEEIFRTVAYFVPPLWKSLPEIWLKGENITSISVPATTLVRIDEVDREGYALRLMSVTTSNDLLNEGRSLVIVALVDTDLHIRIFDALAEKVVDQTEDKLVSGKTLMALKRRLDPLLDESSLSRKDKQEIIANATAITGPAPRYFAASRVTIDRDTAHQLDFGTWIYTYEPVPAEIESGFRAKLLKYLRSQRLTPADDDKERITGIYPRYRARTKAILENIEDLTRRLNQHRNLCEDWSAIEPVRIQQIAVRVAELELDAQADPDEVLARVYFKLEQFIEPQLRLHSLEELLAAGKEPAEIFQGFLLERGFILEEDLQGLERGNNLYTSDLLRLIMQVPGVFALSGLRLRAFVDRQEVNQDVSNCLRLLDPDDFYPRLSLDDCEIQLFRQGVPQKANMTKVTLHLKRLRDDFRGVSPTKPRADLPVPSGQALDLETYYSIQNDFPQTYRLRKGEITPDMPPRRKAQAKQLKGYLLFFEQLLANYCSQLAHLGELFSMQKDAERTYFYQPLYQVPAVQDLYQAFLDEQGADPDRDGTPDPLSWEEFQQNCNGYIKALNFSAEDQQTFRERRNQFLEHLMNRFGESFADYANWVLLKNEGEASSDLMMDQLDFLEDFPDLSARRASAFDYLAMRENDAGVPVPDAWNSENVSGLEKRVSRLLGIPDCRRRSLSDGCDLRMMSASNDEEQQEIVQKFQSEIESNRNECAVLIVSSASTLDEWTIAGLNDEGQFETVLIDDPSNELAVELKKKSGSESKILSLATSILGRTLSDVFDINDYMEIYDEIDRVDDGVREARFRFWNAKGADRSKSKVLLSSTKRYPLDVGLDDEVKKVVEYAQQAKYYVVAQTQPTRSSDCKYYVNLLDKRLDEADPIARRIDYPTNRAEAEQEITEVLHLMQGRYVEGMHLVEHILLRPVEESKVDLAPVTLDPNGNGGSMSQMFVEDPYSFQVSIFLPGWARRFKDPEFRVIVERTLRKEMPAHILPWIYWVNLAEKGDCAAPDQFLQFENAFQDWLMHINSVERAGKQDAFILAFNHLVRQPYVELTNQTAYRPFSIER